ncbi:serine/threonine-protein kinase [Nonomuraea wenchangensis]|uniref:serine/threonine-protein kinase n=1 Tax=Nonomuraea wenchangensis TaxID=568860 RepID=UPI0033270F2C
MGGFEALRDGDPRQVGPFRLVARLGAGGMGRVYLGRSKGGRDVAVKVLRPELGDDRHFLERFAREVALVRSVNGLYTAGVVDADPRGSPPWLATAYVPGPSLEDAVREHGPWPESSVLALGAGLAEALVSIHAAGVVHRDLKPSNVLLAADGPRVIDFGISVALEGTRMTRTGIAMGTTGFVSPEQLAGDPVGPASDVFSLGAVLAFTATGAGPFGEGSWQSVWYRTAHEEPELEALPPGLRALVTRCLAKRPEERPGPAEVLDELVAALGPAAGTSPYDGASWLPDAVAEQAAEATVVTPSPPPPPPVPPTKALPRARPDGVPAAPAPSGRRGGLSRRNLLRGVGGIAGSGAVAGAVAYRLASGPALRTERWSFEPSAEANGLVAADGAVYVRAGDTLYGLDGETGHGRWSYALGAFAFDMTQVMDGALHVRAGKWLHAVDTATGRRRWRTAVGELGAGVFPQTSRNTYPQAADGVIFDVEEKTVRDIPGNFLHAIDMRSGRKLWRSDGPVHASLIADGMAYLVETDDRFWARDARSGRVSYGRDLRGHIPTPELLGAAGQVAYLGVNESPPDTELLALHVRSRSSWEARTTGTVKSVLVERGTAYCLCDEWLFAVDVATGKSRWRSPVEALSSPLTVADGTVYLGGYSGRLDALDAATGRRRWSFHDRAEPILHQAVAGGMVYLCNARDYWLYAIDAAGGHLQWRLRTSFLPRSLVVSDGMVYMITRGKVVAVTA